jgi:hypothetical protein
MISPESEEQGQLKKQNVTYEKIQDWWKSRRESTPPPMIRKGLVALLEARCLTGRISSKLHGSWGLLLHQT